MLVMFIVDMHVVMIERLMDMLMAVPLGKVEVQPKPHQRRRKD